MKNSDQKNNKTKSTNFSYRVCLGLEKLYLYGLLTDKLFLTLTYRFRKGKWINWENPKSFSEKLQWLKLYNRNPAYTDMVDKVKFKEWAIKKIDSSYLIPTLVVYNSPEDIEFDKLPPRFVLKCNHSSGYNYIHSSNKTPDPERIKKMLKINFDRNYFKHGGEWPYKDVKRKILAEQYIEVKNEWGGVLDYKFYCFKGNPEFIQINSYGGHYFYNEKFDIKNFQLFYDKEWNLMEFTHGYPAKGDIEIPKPENFEKMKELAAILSEDIPFVRVDMYNLDGKIYVGELTFFPYNGFHKFYPDESWDYKLGEMLELPSVKKK